MESKQRKTYVFGHRNPDTDSIVSAVAYAALKRQQGLKRCMPVRAGKITPQTEYILKRFNVPVPEFIPDMNPKVEHFLDGPAVTVKEGVALWEALELMDRESVPALPIVDDAGHYKGLLTHHTFARNIIRKADPHRKAIIPTSIRLLLSTLNAQPLLTFAEGDVIKSRLLVAGASTASFEEVLKLELAERAIVVVEDREDIIELCIKSNVRAIVLTGASTLSKKLRSDAEKARISVMLSPYDVVSTIYLMLYTVPVSYMASEKIAAVQARALVREVRRDVAESPARCVAVVDEDNRVVGIFGERDLIKQPNIDIIMVDHNELAQAVEGLEHFRVIEIIDHHRLGNFPTRNPITFINRVVGATSTVVASLYQEQRASLSPEIAGILLSGILTDTLALRSATTTDIDRRMAEYLSGILNIDLETLGKDIFTHASRLSELSAEEMIGTDVKAYTASGKSFSVSQVEAGSIDELTDKIPEIVKALQLRCHQEKLYFAALMVTDITALNSVLVVAGDDPFIDRIAFPRLGENTFLCRGILSRKKQLIPLLLEQMEALLGAGV